MDDCVFDCEVEEVIVEVLNPTSKKKLLGVKGIMVVLVWYPGSTKGSLPYSLCRRLKRRGSEDKEAQLR